MYKERVLAEMHEVFKEQPFWVEHTLDVLQNAENLMEGENVPIDKRELIAIVTLLHDIGVLEAQRKHGSMKAEYQEREGAILARQILEKIGYDSELTNRVCYIVGNHHTPEKIDGLDFKIQWDADMLVNLPRMKIAKDRIPAFIEENFATSSGKKTARQRFIS